MLFREKLAELRAAAGLTQEQLADRSGVPLWTLRKYEQRDKQRVSLNVAARLAKALGTTCEAFSGCEDIAGEDDDPPGEPHPPAKPGRPRKAAAPPGKGKRS